MELIASTAASWRKTICWLVLLITGSILSQSGTGAYISMWLRVVDLHGAKWTALLAPLYFVFHLISRLVIAGWHYYSIRFRLAAAETLHSKEVVGLMRYVQSSCPAQPAKIRISTSVGQVEGRPTGTLINRFSADG